MFKNEKIFIAYFLKIRYILYRKYANIRKITMRLTEEQIIESLKRTDGKYAPFMINSLQEQSSLQDGYQADAIMDCSIQNGPSFKAVVEIKTVATPQNILTGIQLLKAYATNGEQSDMVPLLVAPYIGAKQAEILADNGISWLDLSGNMSIRVSNRIYIERTGKPNRFPDTSPIKKIFQGTSSLVSRALLLRPEGFSTLYEIVDYINNRNAKVTLSTVSKVLKSLEEELLVNRSKSDISVANPERLLERLAEGYKNSTERKRRNTYRFVIKGIERLSYNNPNAIRAASKDYLACGFYAAQIKGLAVTDKITIFVKDMEQFRRKAEGELVSITADEEFGNAIITETSDPGVWFNPDWKGFESVVNDVELYLEMMVDTPRGPKIAKQLKRQILQKGDIDGRKAY
jgi:hypothetical protein